MVRTQRFPHMYQKVKKYCKRHVRQSIYSSFHPFIVYIFRFVGVRHQRPTCAMHDSGLLFFACISKGLQLSLSRCCINATSTHFYTVTKQMQQ